MKSKSIVLAAITFWGFLSPSAFASPVIVGQFNSQVICSGSEIATISPQNNVSSLNNSCHGSAAFASITVNTPVSSFANDLEIRFDSSANASVTANGRIWIEGIDDPELTFILLQPISLPVPYPGREVSLSLKGSYVGTLSPNPTPIEGHSQSGAVITANSGQIEFSLTQEVSYFSAILIHPTLLSPSTCRPQPDWDVKSLAAMDYATALETLLCTPLEGGVTARGLTLYPALEKIEEISRDAATPTLARVAKIRVQRAWNALELHEGALLRQNAAELRSISSWILSTHRNGLLGQLEQILMNFQDEDQKKALLQDALGSLKDSTSDSSGNPLDDKVSAIDQLSDLLDRPSLITADDIDEATLGALAIGLDFQDEASVTGLEGDLSHAMAQ
jgi:hypothetical protein